MLNTDAVKSAGNAIFSKIIAQHRAKKSGKCEKNLWGETGSRFIHISRGGLEPSKKRALYAIPIHHRLIL